MDFKDEYNEWCKNNHGVAAHTTYEAYLELMLEQARRRLNTLVKFVHQVSAENVHIEREMYPTVIDEILIEGTKLSEQAKDWDEIYQS